MTGTRYPFALFTPCAKSHAFDERRFVVPISEENALKIGRSVAQWKPSQENVIFDCKVLSRNHAIIWYEGSNFFLKDTKSSNGTFVNNERLSKSLEESCPCQIYSGDILQFGVEIFENTNHITYGCIIGIMRLFNLAGEEAFAPDANTYTVNRELGDIESSRSFASRMKENRLLFQLQQYLREALHRERVVEQKIITLEDILSATEKATESSWQALVNEDRLLSKIETLEGKLALSSKNLLNDKLREQMTEMIEDKSKCGMVAKESLRRLQEEKNEALQRLTDAEHSLVNTEEESVMLRQRISDLGEELERSLIAQSYLQKMFLVEDRKKSLESEISMTTAISEMVGGIKFVSSVSDPGNINSEAVLIPLPVSSSQAYANVDEPADRKNFSLSSENDDQRTLLQKLRQCDEEDLSSSKILPNGISNWPQGHTGGIDMAAVAEVEKLRNELKQQPLADIDSSLMQITTNASLLTHSSMVDERERSSNCSKCKSLNIVQMDYSSSRDSEMLFCLGLPLFGVFFLSYRTLAKFLALTSRWKQD